MAHILTAPLGFCMGQADKTAVERHAAITWAQRLKRVFNIDIEICEHCGGAVKIIASIEDPPAIKTILAHLENYRDANTRPCHPLRHRGCNRG